MKKWLALWTLCLTGCGAELERSSEVETLRVLGVHKSKSYARGGDDVTLSMLWHDPEGRDITPVWFAVPEESLALVSQLLGQAPQANGPWQSPSEALLPLCVNPLRDSYFGCLGAQHSMFRALAEVELGGLELDPVEALSVRGTSVTLSVPRSLVEIENEEPQVVLSVPSRAACGEFELGAAASCSGIYHPPPDTDGLPDYGSMFTFFALCPGTLTYSAALTESGEGFGLLCLDEDDVPLGPRDFVFGYSQVFLYQDIENENPIVEGMLVAGEEANACIGLDCLEDNGPPPEACGDGIPCLSVCTESDEDNCPEIAIKPIIPTTTAEPDEVAQLAYGRTQGEQMWIRYYSDRARVASEVKLLNDATTGWNPEFGTEIRLPQEPGPLRIWAVVYDNRGGQDWVRVDAVVE